MKNLKTGMTQMIVRPDWFYAEVDKAKRKGESRKEAAKTDDLAVKPICVLP